MKNIRASVLVVCALLAGVGCVAADFEVAEGPYGLTNDGAVQEDDEADAESDVDVDAEGDAGKDGDALALEADASPDVVVEDTGTRMDSEFDFDSGTSTDTAVVVDSAKVDTGVVDTGVADTGSMSVDTGPWPGPGRFACVEGNRDAGACGFGLLCCLSHPGMCSSPVCPTGDVTVGCQTNSDCGPAPRVCCTEGPSKRCRAESSLCGT